MPTCDMACHSDMLCIYPMMMMSHLTKPIEELMNLRNIPQSPLVIIKYMIVKNIKEVTKTPEK